MKIKQEMEERQARANEWKAFRKDHLFTQTALAEALGISRRTVQYVERAEYTPQPETIGAMRSLMARHAKEKGSV